MRSEGGLRGNESTRSGEGYEMKSEGVLRSHECEKVER